MRVNSVGINAYNKTLYQSINNRTLDIPCYNLSCPNTSFTFQANILKIGQKIYRKLLSDPKLIKDEKERLHACAKIISFNANIAAIAAGTLANTGVIDTFFLTACTYQMCKRIAACYGVGASSKMATSVAGIAVGKMLGAEVAKMFVKWIPGIGNSANAAATWSLHTITGLAIYLIYENAYTNGKLDGDKTITLSKDELDKLLKKAKEMFEKKE